jgi:hypothetical protein
MIRDTKLADGGNMSSPMRKVASLAGTALSAVVVAGTACGDNDEGQDEGCTQLRCSVNSPLCCPSGLRGTWDSATSLCHCSSPGPDADADSDADEDAGVEGDACEGAWQDPATGYVWETRPTGGGGNLAAVEADCERLYLCGSGSWRVPTIGELRSLIRGCPATETSGACGVSDSCVRASCMSDACDGCPSGGGPGAGDDYLDGALWQTCSTYWSSTAYDFETFRGWYVNFEYGSLSYGDSSSSAVACGRCILDVP